MGTFFHESGLNILTLGFCSTELLGWLFKAWGKWLIVTYINGEKMPELSWKNI